jgi:glutathione-independent formaldehyde dehydrogenase
MSSPDNIFAVDMGGWVGGQAEYVLAPYADFNLLKFPNRDRAMEKIKDLALLSDIFPTGFHGAVTAGVGPGSTVYVAGAGPVCTRLHSRSNNGNFL